MSPHLRSLHWLPVKQCIKFKWCLLIFKTLKLGLPPYFSPYFVPYTCKISTRHSARSKNMLNRDVVPFNRNIYKSKLHFDNGFVARGPSVWNSLPEKVRCHDSLYTFRRKLKGYLAQLFLHNNPLQWTALLDIDRIWYLTVIMDVVAP